MLHGAGGPLGKLVGRTNVVNSRSEYGLLLVCSSKHPRRRVLPAEVRQRISVRVAKQFLVQLVCLSSTCACLSCVASQLLVSYVQGTTAVTSAAAIPRCCRRLRSDACVLCRPCFVQRVRSDACVRCDWKRSGTVLRRNQSA